MQIDAPEDGVSGNPKSPTAPATSSLKSKPKDSKEIPLTVKWERRKRSATAFAPSPRSGCTMAHWGTRGAGILFGGVTDEDTDEETMKSVFWNDMLAVFLWAVCESLTLVLGIAMTWKRGDGSPCY